MSSFQGKVVVITGAGSGIGRAAALLFVGLGAELALAELREERLDEVRELIGKGGGKSPVCARVDVAERRAVTDFARRVLAEKGRVDVLINNAGLGIMCEIKDMEREEWERLVGINYWGVVNCIQSFLPGMIERRSGHIVNVASANGLFAFPFGGAYASTKFAVVGLSEALRAELTRFNIGVTAVCPGLTNTNILRDGIIKPGSERAKSFMDDFKGRLTKMGVDPMKVAKAIPPAIVKNKALVRAPFHVVPVDLVHRLAPGLYRKIIAMVSTREN